MKKKLINKNLNNFKIELNIIIIIFLFAFRIFHIVIVILSFVLNFIRALIQYEFELNYNNNVILINSYDVNLRII